MKSVLVAGLGGASLGVEIVKCLRQASGYRIVGCDISPLAYGHLAQLCEKSVIVSRERYVDDVLALCRSEDVRVVLPGGEEQMALISAAQDRFTEHGIMLGANTPDVVAQMGDKGRCFEELARLDIRIPRTFVATCAQDLDRASFPCVVKPATESGGSAFVFFARDRGEGALYVEYLLRNDKRPVVQEYIDHEAGEFTVGVLSSPTGAVIGSIALRRLFPAKLSIAARGRDFLISSGFSQGYIGDYPEIRATATAIAQKIGSRGPLNIQGRLDDTGQFVPFEINPRFSASTYLRALAGFNEIDIFIRTLLGEEPPAQAISIREGYYLRGLTEIAVPDMQAPP